MDELQKINDILQTIASVDDDSEQYLSFQLAGELYGVDILRVQEIKGWDGATHVPNSPSYMCGVINLRGTIVPIIDLRRRFDMAFKEYSSRTVVIMLKVLGDDKERIVGVVVDSVSDTHNVEPEWIKNTPDVGIGVNTKYIEGLVSLDNDMMMILDIDRLLSIEALA